MQMTAVNRVLSPHAERVSRMSFNTLKCWAAAQAMPMMRVGNILMVPMCADEHDAVRVLRGIVCPVRGYQAEQAESGQQGATQ